MKGKKTYMSDGQERHFLYKLKKTTLLWMNKKDTVTKTDRIYVDELTAEETAAVYEKVNTLSRIIWTITGIVIGCGCCSWCFRLCLEVASEQSREERELSLIDHEFSGARLQYQLKKELEMPNEEHFQNKFQVTVFMHMNLFRDSPGHLFTVIGNLR